MVNSQLGVMLALLVGTLIGPNNSNTHLFIVYYDYDLYRWLVFILNTLHTHLIYTLADLHEIYVIVMSSERKVVGRGRGRTPAGSVPGSPGPRTASSSPSPISGKETRHCNALSSIFYMLF